MCSQKEFACIGGQDELAPISGQRKVQNISQCVFPQVISYCNGYIIGYHFEMKEMTKNCRSCCKHLLKSNLIFLSLLYNIWSDVWSTGNKLSSSQLTCNILCIFFLWRLTCSTFHGVYRTLHIIIHEYLFFLNNFDVKLYDLNIWIFKCEVMIGIKLVLWCKKGKTKSEIKIALFGEWTTVQFFLITRFYEQQCPKS